MTHIRDTQYANTQGLDLIVRGESSIYDLFYRTEQRKPKYVYRGSAGAQGLVTRQVHLSFWASDLADARGAPSGGAPEQMRRVSRCSVEHVALRVGGLGAVCPRQR